ncbi:MAG: hypothetical protein LBC79_07220 [Deltaproteobacteria bacterium]|jgi:hypothetical protein|nr:hypothetical protein [Deltaproteobacteria bacterium]
MALYLIRAGRNGEIENKFLEDNRIYLGWGRLFQDKDISLFGGYEQIKTAALSADHKGCLFHGEALRAQ